MPSQVPSAPVSTRLVILLAALLFLAALLVAVPQAGAEGAATDCSPTNNDDCAALVELYNSTDGQNWATSDNWLNGSPCDAANGWYGITCASDATSGEERVTSINLSDNDLTGPLPAAVLNMARLESLFLDGNQLSGEIPAVTNNASPLVFLYLNNNAFEGSIPPSLGDLDSLLFLYLNGNILRGAVPAELCDLQPVASTAGNFSLHYNALDIDPVNSDLCLDSARDTGWRLYQTVPPRPRLANLTRQTTAEGADQITVEWQAIPFTGGGGFYEALIGVSSGFADQYNGMPADGHPPQFVRRTVDKAGTSVTFTITDPEQTYYIVVRTQTNGNPAADSNNRNIVISDFSTELVTEPVALSLADFQAAAAGIGRMPALLVLLLALISAGAFVAHRQGRLD